MLPGNYDGFLLGRERQAQMLAEAEHERLARFASDGHPHGVLAWLAAARRLVPKRASEKEWEIWQTMFCRLVEHIARNGFHVKPRSELGRWVTVQRDAHGVGTLNKRRSLLLEALPGWTWARAARSFV